MDADAENQAMDADAENQAMDANAALQELGADYVAYGLFTATVTLWDDDRDRVADKVKSVGRVLRSRGFVVAEETLNAVDAWLSSLPGQCYANLRQPPVSSLNLVHMVPLSSVWAGPERNEHLEEPPLLHARTADSTPFRLVLHQGDVGHTLVVGPTGAGKSVLLNLLDLQFRRYERALVFRFDKGRSSMASILGMAGSFYELNAMARSPSSHWRAWMIPVSGPGRPSGCTCCSHRKAWHLPPTSRKRCGRRWGLLPARRATSGRSAVSQRWSSIAA
jgi:type IV secretion system protein VirB4